MSLTIGVLGYNDKLTEQMLHYVVECDTENQTEIFNRNYIRTYEGTEYRALLRHDNWRGYKFDQIILVDDSRWMIFDKRFDDINILKSYNLLMSCVPEEYQILKLEW